MKYLAKQVNGKPTRDKFIRSMDLFRTRDDPDAALEAYSGAWFSSQRKQYLNEALKMIKSGSLFWPKRAFTDMLDEISMEEVPKQETPMLRRALASDADMLAAKYTLWASSRKDRPVSDEDIVRHVKNFEASYRYRCPDTFRSCWMNAGAYVTLCYGVKYEGLALPGCSRPEESLALLKRCAMEVIADMDHCVDDRMFRLCHAVYAERLKALP